MQNFTETELALISLNGVTPEEVSHVLDMFPQSLDTAIGHVVGLKRGVGQERNKPFQTQEEANADVSLTGGVDAQT